MEELKDQQLSDFPEIAIKLSVGTRVTSDQMTKVITV